MSFRHMLGGMHQMWTKRKWKFFTLINGAGDTLWSQVFNLVAPWFFCMLRMWTKKGLFLRKPSSFLQSQEWALEGPQLKTSSRTEQQLCFASCYKIGDHHFNQIHRWHKCLILSSTGQKALRRYQWVWSGLYTIFWSTLLLFMYIPMQTKIAI